MYIWDLCLQLGIKDFQNRDSDGQSMKHKMEIGLRWGSEGLVSKRPRNNCKRVFRVHCVFLLLHIHMVSGENIGSHSGFHVMFKVSGLNV